MIDRLTVYCLRLPLQRPYKLAFGPVEAYDTVLVEVTLDDGRAGWGEATVLTGYTDETIESAWQTATALAPQLISKPVSEARAVASALVDRAPFTVTAFVSGIEMAIGHPVLSPQETERVPLLAIVNAMENAQIADEIEARLAEGFRTLKVKVGFELMADKARLAFIQDHCAGRATLRVDGNQGYSRSDAVDFVSSIDPKDIELVEQTCAAGDWEAAVAVAEAARVNGVPVMLDESIYGLAEVDRAAELGCADVIKLKLMKMGNLDALIGGLRHVKAKGMKAVLGNGVASDIGCWMEACVAASELDNAGEMNGYLKPAQRLFAVPMAFDAGDLVLRPDEHVVADRDAIAGHAVEQQDVY